ncbi:MAG: non-heme iron oxygenase ferredoxin subunit [Chloroflexaceae bacterium]|nr:non-heme iron oxygenase ferredoxin subunit [Chloroflexaceae bacterium]
MAAIRVASVADVPEGTGKTFEVQGHSIAVFQVGGRFYALDDACSHDEASLGEGEVDTDELCVACPRHGSLFELSSGRARTLPAHKPVSSYPIWVEDAYLVIEPT